LNRDNIGEFTRFEVKSTEIKDALFSAFKRQRTDSPV